MLGWRDLRAKIGGVKFGLVGGFYVFLLLLFAGVVYAAWLLKPGPAWDIRFLGVVGLGLALGVLGSVVQVRQAAIASLRRRMGRLAEELAQKENEIEVFKEKVRGVAEERVIEERKRKRKAPG